MKILVKGSLFSDSTDMIEKILIFLKNPKSGCRKIAPFFRTKLYFARVKKDRRNQNKDVERLRSTYIAYNPLLLHIGCGSRVLENWVNIDLSIAHTQKEAWPENFFAFNMFETGLPLPDNSVDGIFHEDFMEHLDQKEQVLFLAETLRVLKPGSIHRVNTPDLSESMKIHSDFKSGKSGVYVDEWDDWGHKNILTKDYLKEIALLIGYREVVFNSRNESLSKKIPKELRPGDDRAEGGNIFADLIK